MCETYSFKECNGGVFLFSSCFQLFKLGPVQSVCISECSDSSKEVWKIILRLLLLYIYTHARMYSFIIYII
jgi:hypothetical protein